jgi:hypothetical protein
MPVTTRFHNEAKILTIVVSSKYSAKQTCVGLEKAISMLNIDKIDRLYFHSD